MTLELKTYTDSAMSDLIKNFFNTFKENNQFKYVDLIDSKITKENIVEIDYNDFDDEIKSMLTKEPKERIHTALYRAICEVFQIRYASDLEYFKREDKIRFKINNSQLDSKTYSNPNPVYHVETAKEFKNDEWDTVAQIIKKQNYFLTLRENDDIWCYNKEEGIYKPYGNTIIEDECQRLINKCKNQTVREVLGTIKRNNTRIDSNQLFDSKTICALDGILESDFTINPHSPEYMVYSKLPFNLKPKKLNFKLWKQILSIIDNKDIFILMELIWICITWNNPFKKMFIFKGPHDTQKTTLANIITWIIGKKNVSTQKPETFLSKGSRFATSHFIGKRINITGEIGNFTEQWLENLKLLVGGEEQNTEAKFSNEEKPFNPEHFVFLFTTNNLGEIYSKIDDNSVITRFQFMIFRNQLQDSKKNGQWYNSFFLNDEDRQSAIDTVVHIIINYKKAQFQGKAKNTKWSNIEDTKKILQEQLPIEDKYFVEKRLYYKSGAKTFFAEIKKDFESYTGKEIKPQELGIILKKNGLKGHSSNGIVFYNEWELANNKPKGGKSVNEY